MCCAKCSYVDLNLHSNLMRKVLSHLMDEKTETQRGKVIWPRPHNWQEEEPLLLMFCYRGDLFLEGPEV